MKTFIIDRDEHSELPCEGVFWVVGDTLICFVEPMNYSSDSDVNYLNYNSCWEYLRTCNLGFTFANREVDFYPKGRVTVVDTGDLRYSTYTVNIKMDRILQEETYEKFLNNIERIYNIHKSKNDCSITYVYDCLF